MTLETEALRDIERTLSKHARPLIPFSGGKDSLTVLHMITRQIGLPLPVFSVVCVLFPEEERDVYEAAQRLEVSPTFHYELTPQRLAAVHHEFFPPATGGNSQLYQRRHIPAIDRTIRKNGHDLAIFGRRREENSIPSKYYQRKNFPAHSLHPLIDWPVAEVWRYLDHHQVWRPRCYAGGAKQLRTWVSYLLDGYAKRGLAVIGELYERYPPAVTTMAAFWAPARTYLESRHAA
jgi:3'-phosphoadenosine 5'-phosphosulfate sulfotransferase (PAPS reductase)/FAD synthetase